MSRPRGLVHRSGAWFLLGLSAIAIFAACTSESSADVDPCPTDPSVVGSGCSIEDRLCPNASATCPQALRCVSGRWALDPPTCSGGSCVTHCADVVTKGSTPCPGSAADSLSQAFVDCICAPANCGMGACMGPCAGTSEAGDACNTCATNVATGGCKTAFDACINGP